MQNVTAARHQESYKSKESDEFQEVDKFVDALEVPDVSASARTVQVVTQSDTSKSRGRRSTTNTAGTSGNKRKRVDTEVTSNSSASLDKRHTNSNLYSKVNKRLKLVFDIHQTFEDMHQVLNSTKLQPLLNTPSALFETLCANFEAEYPGLLSEADTQRIVNHLTQLENRRKT